MVRLHKLRGFQQSIIIHQIINQNLFNIIFKSVENSKKVNTVRKHYESEITDFYHYCSSKIKVKNPKCPIIGND